MIRKSSKKSMPMKPLIGKNKIGISKYIHVLNSFHFSHYFEVCSSVLVQKTTVS